MPLKQMAKPVSGILIGLLLSAVLVCAIEILLTVFTPHAYYVWLPNLRSVFRPDPAVTPGVGGEKQFSINSEGLRGEEFSPEQSYRLLAIGGSTTECLILDDSEAWPYLVQQMVNAQQSHLKLWVGNAGKSGHNTRHHILQVQRLLAQYERIDVILLLTGINDLTLRLREDTGYVPYAEVSDDVRLQVVQMAFAMFPSWESVGPFYKRSELWRRLKLLKEKLLSPWAAYMQDERGGNLVRWRANRSQATEVIDALPDLDSALREYSDNLRMIVQSAKERRTRVILMTQPVLWEPGLPDDLAKLLWLGGIGDFQAAPGSRYYSVDALSRMMAAYNQTLMGLCRQEEVECIDLASQLPHSSAAFYDDVHFNEQGSRKVANIVSRHLLERPPFAAHLQGRLASPQSSVSVSSVAKLRQ